MPLYEYKCESCGLVEEAFDDVEHCDEPLRVECLAKAHGCKLDRILSATPTNFTFADKSAHKQSR